jgi:hypothetical protein
MQTFLPYADFELSAEVLDHRRLGKQRVETMQIMTALCGGRGWTNHPAVKMWRGYEESLLRYQDAICRQWVFRGYRDTCWDKTLDILDLADIPKAQEDPWWLGAEDFHRAHQSNLIRKNPEYYRPLFPGVPDNLEYLWPV